MRRREHRLDLGERHVAPQLDGERLAVATHRANANAQTVDGDGTLRSAEDLVAFSLGLPFFLALPVAEIRIDPRQQAARQGMAEVRRRKAGVPQRVGNRAIDVEDRGCGIVEQ